MLWGVLLDRSRIANNFGEPAPEERPPRKFNFVEPKPCLLSEKGAFRSPDSD